MKLDIDKEQAREIVWGEDDDFEIMQDEIVDNRRWSIDHRIVVKRKSDGRFFADTYSVGATENQDESAYEYSEPNFQEVFPIERTVISYEHKAE